MQTSGAVRRENAKLYLAVAMCRAIAKPITVALRVSLSLHRMPTSHAIASLRSQ